MPASPIAYPNWLTEVVRSPRGHWLPFAALAGALVAVIAADLAVFGVRGPGELDQLGMLHQHWIGQAPAADPGFAAAARAVEAIKDATARLSWMVIGLFQTVAFACWAIPHFSLVIAQSRGRRTLFALYGCLASAALVLALGDGMGWSLDRLLGSGLAYSGIIHDRLYEHYRVGWIKWIIAAENGLALAVIVLGTFAACVTIAGTGLDAGELAARMARLRRLLTVSAAVMIIGVVQVSAEFRWPAAVVQDKVTAAQQGRAPQADSKDAATLPLAEALTSYAASVTLMAGGSFTLFMIAVFGTAFLVLDAKARDLAAARTSAPWLSDDEWRKARGISLSWGDIYADMSKILGPLVVAVVGGFIKF